MENTELDLTKVSELELGDNTPIQDQKVAEFNPFSRFVRNENSNANGKLVMPELNLNYHEPAKTLKPLTISTKEAQPYISKGFKLADIDIHDGLEAELSSTQSGWDRKVNNLKNAGANLVSMAVLTGFSNPLDMGFSANLSDNTLGKKLFDWSAGIQKDNYNYQTKNDIEAKGLWDNLTNWIDPTKDSTKGIGKLLESVAFGVGAGLGIMAQESVVSLATGGSGTFPLLATKIQQILNGSEYLTKALKFTNIAEKGALNLERVIGAGDITNSTAKALNTIYKSQLGSHSEALFEGLEGKESLKNDLIRDYESTHGYKPLDVELAKIEKVATQAGQARYAINKALLSVTNFAQFNSLFKAFDPQKEVAESTLEKFGKEVMFDPVTKKVIAKNTGYQITSPWFEKGIRAKLKPFVEGAVNVSKNHLVDNGLIEGVEEGLQFFTDKALNNYYSWKYHGDNKSANDAIYEGTKAMFSKDGIESIFTGIVSGAGQSAVTKYFASLSPNFKAQKKLFEGHQGELLKVYQDLDAKFQALPLESKKKLVNVINKNSIGGTVANKAQMVSATSGTSNILNEPEDEEQFNQALTHKFYTMALPYARHGNIDILKNQFEEYKNLDDKSFLQTFGISDIKNKNAVIDLYLREFDNIQKSYRAANNAFSKSPATPALQNEYQYLKTELAFSLYNSDKLIKDSKTLEEGIGTEYLDMLGKGLNGFPSFIQANKDKITELEKEIDSPLKTNKIGGLLITNEYLESVMSGKRELKKEEYLEVLNNHIVNPYIDGNYQEKDRPDVHKDINDKLNKIYQLSKIKDRVRYTQKKLNRILNSDNPLDYLQQQENTFENQAFTYSQRTNPPAVIVNKNVVEVITDEEYSKFQVGDVSKEILTKIAVKLKDKKSLSTRENEIAAKFKDAIDVIKAELEKKDAELAEILNPGQAQLPLQNGKKSLDAQIAEVNKKRDEELDNLKKGIATFITNKLRAELDFYGFTKEQISNMTPVQANKNVINAKYNKEIEDLKNNNVSDNHKDNIKITPLQLSQILSGLPSQYKINSILGLDIMDSSGVDFLEKKGIISKSQGAKPRTFLKTLEEALNILNIQEEKIEDIKKLNNVFLDLEKQLYAFTAEQENEATIIEQKQIDLLNTPLGLQLRKAWSFGLIEENSIAGINETNYIEKETEFVNGNLVEKDNYIGYYYLPNIKIGEDYTEEIRGESKEIVEKLINAKYDAELKELDNDNVNDSELQTKLKGLEIRLKKAKEELIQAEKEFKEKVTDEYEKLKQKGIDINDNFLGKDEYQRTEKIYRSFLFKTQKNLRKIEEEISLLIDKINPNSLKIGGISKLKQDIDIFYIKDTWTTDSSLDDLPANEIADILKDISVEYLDSVVLQKGYAGEELLAWFKKGRDFKVNGNQENEESEEDLNYDLDNIESKQYESVYLIDADGKILKDEKVFNERSKELINVLNNVDPNALNDFTNKINYTSIGIENGIDNEITKIKGKSIPIHYPMEKALARLDPKEGIRLSKDGNEIGFISTSDDLYVDLTMIEEVLKKDVKGVIFTDEQKLNSITNGTGNQFITYTAFLKILETNVILFNIIKNKSVEVSNAKGEVTSIPLIFKNIREDINDLIIKQENYLNAKAKLLSLLKEGEDKLKKYIVKNQMIDFQAFINYKKATGILYKVKDTLLVNQSSNMSSGGLLHGHLVNVTWKDGKSPNIDYVTDLYPENPKNKKLPQLKDLKIDEQKDISKYIRSLPKGNFPGVRKYIAIKQKNADGSISWKLIDTVNQSLLVDDLKAPITNINELKSYLNTVDIQSSTINDKKYSDENKVKFSINGFVSGNQFDIKIGITHNGEPEIFDNVLIKITNSTKGEILKAIKESLDKGFFGVDENKTDLKLNTTLYKVEDVKDLTRNSLDNIKIDSYFDKNPQQIYTTLYLKVKPLDNVVAPVAPVTKSKNVIKIERRRSLSDVLINIVWQRLTKKGITNVDSITGTRATIDNVDFNKFWGVVNREDLENLKKEYQSKKQETLDLFAKFKGAFDPSTGTFTSNDTSYYDDRLKDVNLELANFVDPVDNNTLPVNQDTTIYKFASQNEKDAKIYELEMQKENALATAFPGMSLDANTIKTLENRGDKKASAFITKYDGIVGEYDAKINKAYKTEITPSAPVVDDVNSLEYQFDRLIKLVPDDGNWGMYFPKDAKELLREIDNGISYKIIPKVLQNEIVFYLRYGGKKGIVPVVNKPIVPDVVQKVLNLGYGLSEKAIEMVENPAKGYESLINVLVKQGILNIKREFDGTVRTTSMLVVNKNNIKIEIPPATLRTENINNNKEELKEIVKRCI